MKEKWTGDLIGRMHNADITLEDLAVEIGKTKAYVSMILNGHRKPANARQLLEEAFKAAKAKKSSNKC